MLPLRRVGLDTGNLTDEELRYIYNEIIGAAWAALRAREIFEREPVPSVGYRTIRKYTETDMSQALIDIEGETISIDRTQLASGDVTLPTIHKEFVINWRDLDANREVGEALNLREARNAARQCSEEENKLLFSGEYTGWRAYGIEGLMTATGRSTGASAGAWPANAVVDINTAIGNLESSGFTSGPYVLCAPVAEVRKLHVSGGAGYAGLTYYQFLLKNGILNGIIADDSIFPADGNQDGACVVVPGRENFSLQVARDITVHTAPLPNMNLFGRVYEVVTPMIKRPTSISEITAIT